MAKPILVIYLPGYITKKQLLNIRESYIKLYSKTIGKEYHVLIIGSFKDEIDVKLLHINGAKEIDLAEIKKYIEATENFNNANYTGT